MASMRHFPRGLACSSGKKLAIFEYSERDGVTKKEIELQGSSEISSADIKPEDEDAIEKKAPSKNEEHILATSISPSGRYLAVCDNVKQLHLYDAKTEWTRHSRRELPRRCTAVTFTNDDLHVLVADKTGDVYRYRVGNGETEENSKSEEDNKGAQLMLGHLSMLLDVVLTKDDQYIVTCDRDEKIRVSHYPNCYNIHTFCLGHRGYVTSLVYIKESNLLISGGEHGYWRLSPHPVTNHDNGVVAAICYGCSQVYVFQLVCSASGVSLTGPVIITTEMEPWDICFDFDHQLWVLQPNEDICAKVYEWSKDDNMMKIVNTGDKTSSVGLLLEAINSNWQFFKESVGVTTHLPEGLKKVKVDNMKDYLEKKQERVSGVKRKTDQSESKDSMEKCSKNS
ncbi:tRNA (guanine-N(7)-)-methyltransferase non-catalytic subunit wdr4-like [Ylistrum balloti]|uniref:tRNA (guanine-N(7)-)-methyltransferase non-catalytic subunit wdr4-like n=1 Tax=Ylistrum balloti TaxID=509963 RepID=UPI002905C59F|nr:tRNA (guanine-N(7)-)-methyltransferase non-catalytic subunit wdr4-like [Ylistrum balloti]